MLSIKISKGMFLMMIDVERWVLYPWFEEHGADHIHPDDFERFRALKPYGLVFRNLGTDFDFCILEYAGEKFRVREELIQAISFPTDHMFKVGDLVRINVKDDVGEVVEVRWHHKEQKPIYTLKITGRKKGKRYWPEELSITDMSVH